MTESKQRHFISATPGFYVLDFVQGDASGRLKATRETIVAWEIRPRSPRGDDGFYAYLVTPDFEGDLGNDKSVPILHPDGSVHIAGDTIFASAAEWFEAVEAKGRARRQG